MMNYFTDLDLSSVFNIITAPILIFFGGLVSWFIKTRREELREIEERALEKRMETINIILNPFIMLFASVRKDDKKLKEKAISEITSSEYRKASFNLMTFGSDQLVNSYNDMMQGYYNHKPDEDPNLTMKRFANFILSIRKDLYNKNTKLTDWDMLKFMLNDFDQIDKK